MKTGAALFLVSFGIAAAQSTEPAAEAKRPGSSAAVRSRIAELVKRDAARLPPVRSAPAAAPPAETDAANDAPPLPAHGVLELDPFTVTKQRDVVLPPIPKLTLENFFYGDGTIARQGRASLSAGPTGTKGVAAIKLNIKF